MRRAWTSSVASQTGRKRTGAGVSASAAAAAGGRRAPCLARPGSVAARCARAPFRRRHVEARPVGDLGGARGAEALQVAADEQLDPLVLGRRLAARPSPPRARTDRRGGAPTSRGRNANQVHEQARRAELASRRPPRARRASACRRRTRAEPCGRSRRPSSRRDRGRACASTTCAARAGSRRRTASSRAARRGGSSPASSTPWMTLRRSSARVSWSRSKPWRRDQSPMYIDGAYCAWIPPIRSSARGRGVFARSSSSCRASSARFSSRSVSVRVTSREPNRIQKNVLGPA